MALWSLKIAIDPKLTLIEKTRRELVERLQADPRVFPGRPHNWPHGKTLGSARRRSASSLRVFSTRPSGCPKISIFGVLSSGSHSFKNAFQKNLRRVLESWKPCDFKTVLTFYTWLSEVWEKYDLLSVLFGSIVSNYSRIHWQKLISWKFDKNFCIFCKIESIYVQINSLEIIKSTQTAVLSRFRFTVFCYTKLVKFCHHVIQLQC